MAALTTGEGVKVSSSLPLSDTSTSSLSLSQDIEVEKEDQMRINLFARKNARLLDIREKITEREVRNTKIDLTLSCVKLVCFFSSERAP